MRAVGVAAVGVTVAVLLGACGGTAERSYAERYETFLSAQDDLADHAVHAEPSGDVQSRVTFDDSLDFPLVVERSTDLVTSVDGDVRNDLTVSFSTPTNSGGTATAFFHVTLHGAWPSSAATNERVVTLVEDAMEAAAER